MKYARKYASKFKQKTLKSYKLKCKTYVCTSNKFYFVFYSKSKNSNILLTQKKTSINLYSDQFMNIERVNKK